MVGPVAAAQLAKVKMLLESAWNHRPYKEPMGLARMAAWSQVSDDVWGDGKPLYDVEVRFTQLMYVPVKHQRMFYGWDERMYALHAWLSKDYKSVQEDGGNSSGDATVSVVNVEETVASEAAPPALDVDHDTDGAIATTDDELAPPDDEPAPPVLEAGETSGASAAAGGDESERRAKRPRLEQCVASGGRGAMAGGVPASIDLQGARGETTKADEPVGADPLLDECLLRVLMEVKPHKNHAKGVWKPVEAAVRAHIAHAPKAKTLSRRFKNLLCNTTYGSEHPKLSSMTLEYCKAARYPSNAMKAFVRASASRDPSEGSAQATKPASAKPRASTRPVTRSTTLEPSERVLRPVSRLQDDGQHEDEKTELFGSNRKRLCSTSRPAATSTVSTPSTTAATAPTVPPLAVSDSPSAAAPPALVEVLQAAVAANVERDRLINKELHEYLQYRKTCEQNSEAQKILRELLAAYRP